MKLTTSLPIAECQARLAATLGTDDWFLGGWPTSPNPMRGTIDGHSFHVRKTRYWRNDCAPMFHARLTGEKGETSIEGEFDLPIVSKWFFISMFCSIGLVLASLLVPLAISIVFYRAASELWMLPVLMAIAAPIALFCGVTCLLRADAANDEAEIMAYLTHTLEAKIVSGLEEKVLVGSTL